MRPGEGRVAFDRFVIDLESRELACGRKWNRLQEKPFRLLLALLERPGRVVVRRELYDCLWPAEIHVDREAGLNTAIRKLRAALRELADGDGDLVETVPRAGYRLMVTQRRWLPPDSGDGAFAGEGGGKGSGDSGGKVRGQSLISQWMMLGAALLVVTIAAVTSLPSRSPSSPASVAEQMPTDPEQRARYLEARTLLGAAGGDFARARELLRSVIEAEPDFAPAHAYLAEASTRFAMRSAAMEDLEEAQRAAEQARQLDPDSSVAHRVLAMIALIFEWDFQEAGEQLAIALDLDPSDPVTVLALAGYESARGRHDAAIAAVRRAVDLEPDSMLVRSDAGYFLLRAGRFHEAAAECELALRIDSDNAYAHDCLLTAYSWNGDRQAARSHAIELLRLSGASESELAQATVAPDARPVYLLWALERLLGSPRPPAVQIAATHLALGNLDQALIWLDEAARQRDPLWVFVPHDATFAPLHGRSRYHELVHQAGLAEVETAPDSLSG